MTTWTKAAILCGVQLATVSAQTPPTQTQTVPLTLGWNLISLQVGGAITPQQFTGQLATNGLLSIWSYDNATRTWQNYSPTNTPNTLTNLVPGHGDWVKVSKANTLTFTGPVWAGPINLIPGWNLVGFPGLTFDPTEQLDLASVFRAQINTVPRIWRYDGGTSQRYVGYDALALPALTHLKSVEPGKGYWVYSLGNLTLTPTASVALAGDGDISPLQLEESFNPQDSRFPKAGAISGTNAAIYTNQIVRYAGSEDAAEALNHNGILDSPVHPGHAVFPQWGESAKHHHRQRRRRVNELVH